MCREWITRKTARFSPCGERLAHIRRERALQTLLSCDNVVRGARALKLFEINKQRLREEFLHRRDRLDHRFDLRLLVVRLIDHVLDVEIATRRAFRFGNRDENAENAIGIDRAGREVIVGVMSIVEVESAERTFIGEERDDVLDILPRQMMPRINEHFRLRTRVTRERRRHAPISDICVVEGWLERLVFHEHAHRRIERIVYFAQRIHESPLAPHETALPWIVRAVGKPERERSRANRTRKRDRVEQVLNRTTTHGCVLTRDRTVSIALILKDVWIDRTDS